MTAPSDTAASDTPVCSARVLIVEDRALVASKVERSVRAAGHAVAGVLATVGAALAYMEQAGACPDAAILDIDLRGEPVYPVAERLCQRGVPFLFLTGYGRPAIDARWEDVVRIEKPFEADELARTLAALLHGRPVAAEEPGPPLTPPMRRAWENLRKSRDIITEARAWQETYEAKLPPNRP